MDDLFDRTALQSHLRHVGRAPTTTEQIEITKWRSKLLTSIMDHQRKAHQYLRTGTADDLLKGIQLSLRKKSFSPEQKFLCPLGYPALYLSWYLAGFVPSFHPIQLPHYSSCWLVIQYMDSDLVIPLYSRPSIHLIISSRSVVVSAVPLIGRPVICPVFPSSHHLVPSWVTIQQSNSAVP